MFRFTIRDVLWLTVVAALVVGWWLERRQLRADVTSLRLMVKEARAMKQSDLDAINSEIAARIKQFEERGVPHRSGRLPKTIRDEKKTEFDTEFDFVIDPSIQR